LNTWLLVVIACQWLGLIGLGVLVLGIARQVGVLHQRLGPVGALMLSKELKVGERSPEFPLVALDGRQVLVGGADPQGRSSLIAFVSPDCPVCASLLPTIKRIAAEENSRLKVVFASDGDPAVHRRFASEKGLDEFPYVLSGDLGRSFGIGRLPYAVIIDAAGVIRSQGLVNSREHLESLLEANRLGVASIQDYLAKRAQAEAGAVSPVKIA
jgi:methylamine dehydrogenase accessory protein MauD